jgi:acyl-CoA thioesterase
MEALVREAIAKQMESEPFARKFGLKLVHLSDGHSVVEMTVRDDMSNMFGTAHGGAIFALIDSAFETASNSHGTIAVALNVTVNYVAAASRGDTLTAEAYEIARTRKTANYDIRVYDGRRSLIASCQALAYRKGVLLPFLEEEPSPSP